MKVEEVATKVVMAVGFLLYVYILWLVFPSEIPDLIYRGGAIFLLIVVLAFKTSQTK